MTTFSNPLLFSQHFKVDPAHLAAAGLKEASRTNYGVFVILDYGGLGKKLEIIQQIRRERLARGEPASEIVVIDASKKASASKRI